jgi:hypothetical protein
MRRVNFWYQWLLVVSLIVVIFGLILAFLYGTALFKPLDEQLSAAFWSNPGDVTAAMHHYQHWLVGVLGALFASWGVLLAFITYYPFKRQEKWAWNGLVTALIVWFVVDESFSLYFHVYLNALGNLVFLLLLALPLFFTRKDFVQAAPASA